MEKKKKDVKISSTANQPETNDLLSQIEQSKEDQNQSYEGLAPMDTKTSSSPHEHAYSQNQQYPPVLQWPYAPQHAVEQQPLMPKPSVPSQSASPVVVNRLQQLPHLQPNSTGHQVQQCQPLPHLAQPAAPFWLPQRPGYHFAGASVPLTFQPHTPLAVTDASWPASGAVGGGTSSRNQPQVPTFCYHVGYPYPGFPGPWDPTSWWGQAQQSQPPCTFNFPGAYGYFSSPSMQLPGCSASFAQSSDKGIIKPPAKLSQKHQQLWEAQSAENVHLWTKIGELQSEIEDYKCRLIKLEAEVSALNPTVARAPTQVTGTVITGQRPKRGRPRRKAASVDVLASPGQAHPQARSRELAPSKIQHEARTVKYEKVSLTKVDNKEKECLHESNTQHENEENISNMITKAAETMAINRSNVMMPVFHNHIHREIPGGQICRIAHNSSSEMKSNNVEPEDSKATFSLLSWQAKGINNKANLATYIGATSDGTRQSPPNITSEDSGRGVLNISSHGLYNNGCVIRQEGKVIPGWSFVNGEDASEEFEDAVVGSGKDENDEEMEDDDSSGAEGTKDEDTYDMDARGGTSSKGLPGFNNWQ